MAGALRMTRDTYDGILLMTTASQRSEEVIRWARNDKRVWRVLVRLLNATDLGNMLVGHSLLFMGMVMHHRGQGEHPILHQFGLTESQVMGAWMKAQAGMNGVAPDESNVGTGVNTGA